jgi:hypothetical protein
MRGFPIASSFIADNILLVGIYLSALHTHLHTVLYSF